MPIPDPPAHGQGEIAVDLFEVIRTILVVVVSVSILVPLNIPLAALAYRVQLGTKPLPMEPTPFWFRSAGVALGLALMCGVLMAVDWWLVVFLGLPAGFIHVIALALYLMAGVWYVFWMFGFDEMIEGASVFGIYLAIPGLLLAFPMMTWRWWPVPLVEVMLKSAA